ncbi:MAG: FkbM family methyltransferase, partial [Acidimicrobiia bacterium]
MTESEELAAKTRVGPGIHGDFVLPEGDLLLQQVLEFGGHTRPEVAMVASVVRAGDTIIDVGAHVGTFAIPLARQAGPTGLVCAFEPMPWSYELLLLNIELNGLAGVIWPVDRAVSDRPGNFLAETPNQGNTGGSYLVDAADGVSSVTLDA